MYPRKSYETKKLRRRFNSTFKEILWFVCIDRYVEFYLPMSSTFHLHLIRFVCLRICLGTGAYLKTILVLWPILVSLRYLAIDRDMEEGVKKSSGD